MTKVIVERDEIWGNVNWRVKAPDGRQIFSTFSEAEAQAIAEKYNAHECMDVCVGGSMKYVAITGTVEQTVRVDGGSPGPDGSWGSDSKTVTWYTKTETLSVGWNPNKSILIDGDGRFANWA